MTKIYNSFVEFANSAKAKKKLKKRYRKEKKFKIIGFSTITISILFLLFLVINISIKSQGAFSSTMVKIPIFFDSNIITSKDKDFLARVNYRNIFMNSLKKNFLDFFNDRRKRRDLVKFFSRDIYSDIKKYIIAHPDKIGKTEFLWLKTSSRVDQYYKGHTKKINKNTNKLLKTYFFADNIKKTLSFNLLTRGDSTYPELAGIIVALVGSLLTMIIFLLISFPLAILLALYLEEFTKKNKLADFIEININNLAAIPSIIFGLLGLAVFINLFGMPRSSSLVGGFTLALMVLPTIVIATRNSIKAIPQNIKDAALALGASKVQVALHHTLLLAFPGILTGTILAVARAMGETAPLLMIGMISFIVEVPSGFADPATLLPVQIYLWSNNPGIGFIEKTSATILILLLFLVFFNSLAIFLRNKFSRRW